MKNKSKQKGLVISIAIVQLVDILIHLASDQLEMLRVSSNIVILTWIIFHLFGKLSEKIKLISIISITIYTALNTGFILLNGTVNPDTGGFRTPLFLLVISTIILSTISILKNRTDR